MVDFVTATLPAATSWYKSAWNGSICCAVALSSNTAATSPDGITWTARTLPVSGFSGLTSDGAQFVGVRSGTSTAYTSPDGITWTPRTLPSSSTWVDVAWNGIVFCAISEGTVAATSPDGITWTPRTLPASANSKQGIARATFGFCVFAFDTAAVYTSAEGISWSTVVLPTRDRYSLANDGTTNCVPIYGADITETSFDGVTWGDVGLPPSSSWYLAVWDGTEFIAISNTGTAAATSPDGVVWSAYTLPVSGTWQGLSTGGGITVALREGTNMAIVSSTVLPPGEAFWTERLRATEVV